MSVSLRASYAYCRRIARARARNFYYAFLLLPRPKRRALCAIYAFMRRCDDLADAPGVPPAEARLALDGWRAEMDAALAGGGSGHPLWPAFRHAVETFRIPPRCFHELLAGVAGDLEPRVFRTFDDLYRYCYQVASTVGLTIIHVLGFRSQEAIPLAEKCGIAFQLTNILRDIQEDAERGRIYLPAEELERFGVSLTPPAYTSAFVELMRFQVARARACYDDSRPLLGLVDPSARRALWALIEIYSRLLARIEQARYNVLTRRLSLPARQKLWIVGRAIMGGSRAALRVHGSEPS